MLDRSLGRVSEAMPISNETYRRPDEGLQSDDGQQSSKFLYSAGRRLSDDSIRTELCEGPVLNEQISPPPIQASTIESEERLPPTSDREELIRRIKSGEKATWRPSGDVSWIYSYC